MQVAEHARAQPVENALPGDGQVERLEVLGAERGQQHAEVDQDDDGQAVHVASDDAVDGLGDEERRGQVGRRADDHAERPDAERAPYDHADVLAQPPHHPRVVDAAEDLVVGAGVDGAAERLGSLRLSRTRIHQLLPFGAFGALAGKLAQVGVTVKAVAGHQLVVLALLDYPAVFQHEDQVGVADDGQAVGDDESRPALDELAERLADEVLGLSVDAGGRVVEDKDGRVDQQRAGDGHALLLAAGEGHAPLADPGIVAIGQALDEVVDLGRLGRGDDLFGGCLRRAVGDVVPDRARVEEHVLLRDAHVLAQRGQRDVADVGPVHGDAARR